MTLSSLLEPIKQRLAKVIDLEWKDADDWYHDCRVGVTLTEGGSDDEEAAAFIAHAPTDLARLIRALEVADAALEYYANHKSVIGDAYHSNADRQITVVHTFINHKATEARAELARILKGEKE